MKQSSISRFLLLTTVSFLGGLSAGLLFSPRSGKENRKWLNDHGLKFLGQMEKTGKDSFQKGRHQIGHIRRSVKKKTTDLFPDLYDATETIELEK